MKITKRLMPLLLCSALLVSGCGCSSAKKTDVEDVIISELDLLKNLDTQTTQKYISYKELFPGADDDTELSAEVEEVFSLFFKDFDYKILEIDVDTDKKSATASIRLSTIDANSVAKDFSRARLKDEILNTSQSDEKEDDALSLEANYLLLNQVLKNKDYKKVENSCTMTLKENQEDTWEIQRTKSLENQLVGGLLTYLSDPNLIPPKETVSIYLDTLKDMDDDQMCSYLGMSSLLNSSDSSWNAVALAVVEQIHKSFNYEIQDAQENGYSATVNVAFTTFDSDSILTAHQAKLEDYLASADAVIDGSAKRLEKSHQLLLETIKNNTATTTSTVPFRLTNNGAAWEIEMDDNQLGKALFGSLVDNLTGTDDTADLME